MVSRAGTRRGGAARIAPIAALTLAVALVAVLLLSAGATTQELTVRLQNASQLVTGNQVKVGGVAVGTIDAIELGRDDQAEVRITVDDEDLVPLRRGTRAVVRISSLSSVANRYISLEPGPNDAPELPDGGTIPVVDTQAAVDLDAVIATLDADTRSHLQRLTKGAAGVYAGDGARDLNRGLVTFNPAVAQLEATLSELVRDRAAFERFVVSGASWVSAVADREADLEGGLAAAATTAGALAAEREDLQSLLRRAPGTLRQARGTLARTGATLDAIIPAVREAGPVAPRLSRLMADLDPTLERLVPAIDQVRPLLPDLVRFLRSAPAVQRSALPAFRSAAESIAASLPMIVGLRPYTPDVLLGATNGFGGSAAGPYDANGGFGRIGALTGTLAGAAGAGSLAPTLPSGVTFGNTKRCPGAATQVARDGSNRIASEIPCEEDQRP